MPKKKLSRKGLLLSLLTLVIALAVAGTSTYAWFAVNRSVTASNMQVTVKNDTTYLVIAQSATPITTVAGLGTEITATATASDAEVLPVRYNPDGTGATKWETARGEDYDDADAKNNEYTAVATADLDDYVVKYTFYVGLTPTTALPATDLMVTALTATANSGVSNVFLPAISCLVVCSDGTTTNTVDFENVNSNPDKGTGAAVISSTVALNKVYTIDVYVYVNGEHANVTSENATAANLGGFKLSMTLGCTPGSEA